MAHSRHLDDRHRDCLWAMRVVNASQTVAAQKLNRPLQWVQENWNRVDDLSYPGDAMDTEDLSPVGELFAGHGHHLGSIQSSLAFNSLMPEPLIFIEQGENGKFRLNREVVQLLRQQYRLFSSVAIVGKYRTGKSFLMNQLMECMRGFVVGHTVQTQTKGIWMWMKEHPDDPSNLLILLDTEGTSDVEKSDEESDTKLLALTTLLCSTLTLNTVGVLDNKNIQQLELLTSFTDIIKTESNRKPEDGSSFGKYFPRLIVLVRDFTLERQIDGEEVSAEEYLENALIEKAGRNKATRVLNDTKDCIKNYFPNRTCYTMVKPTEFDADLKNLSTGAPVRLSPEFIQQMGEVKQLIISDGLLYTMNGYPIMASDFVDIAEDYIEALNKGSTPCIQSAANRLKIVQQERVAEKVIKEYNSIMCTKAADPMEEYQLEGVHRSASERALLGVRSERVFENDETAIAKLKENLQHSYGEFVKKHREDRTNMCKAWLHACVAEVNEHIKGNHYTNHGDGFDKYETDMHAAIETYRAITQGGPVAESVLEEHLQLREGEKAAIRNAAQIAGEKEEQIQLAELRMREEDSRNRQLEKESHERLIRELERERQTYETTLGEIHAKFLVENERMQELLRESVQKVQKLREEGVNKMEEVENMVREMNLEARRLRESANNFG